MQSVIKTERTDRFGKGDSNVFNIHGSGVSYRTGIQAFLIQQKLQVYADTLWSVRLTQDSTVILITVITVIQHNYQSDYQSEGVTNFTIITWTRNKSFSKMYSKGKIKQKVVFVHLLYTYKIW